MKKCSAPQFWRVWCIIILTLVVAMLPHHHHGEAVCMAWSHCNTAEHTVPAHKKRLHGSEHAHVPPRWHAASVCRRAHMAAVLSAAAMRGSAGMPDTDNLQGNAHQRFQAFLWLPPSDGRACPALSFGLNNGKNHHYLSSFLFTPRYFSDSPDAAKPTPGGCGVACLSKGEIRPFFQENIPRI